MLELDSLLFWLLGKPFYAFCMFYLKHFSKYIYKIYKKKKKKDISWFGAPNFKRNMNIWRKNRWREDLLDILKKRASTFRCIIYKLYGHNLRTCQRDNVEQVRGARGGRGSRGDGGTLGLAKGIMSNKSKVLEVGEDLGVMEVVKVVLVHPLHLLPKHIWIIWCECFS